MKLTIVLAALFISSLCFASGGALDGLTATNADTVVAYDSTTGKCKINNWDPTNATDGNNNAAIGALICSQVMHYNVAGFTQITGGSFPGAYQVNGGLDIASKCTIQNSGLTGSASTKATCNDAVSCSAMSPPTC